MFRLTTSDHQTLLFTLRAHFSSTGKLKTAPVKFTWFFFLLVAFDSATTELPIFSEKQKITTARETTRTAPSLLQNGWVFFFFFSKNFVRHFIPERLLAKKKKETYIMKKYYSPRTCHDRVSLDIRDANTNRPSQILARRIKLLRRNR